MDVFDPKTADEKYYLGFDFDNDLGSATISSATVEVRELVDGGPSGDAITSMINNTKQFIDGSIVYFWIQAGTAGTYYVIECEITASDGSIYEGQGIIEVKALK